MIEINKDFLQTGMSQKVITEILVEKLAPMLDECAYNVKRYNVPMSLVLFYANSGISELITEHKRLTDIENSVQIDGSYFTFVFLPFTDVQDSFSFINHVEYHVSTKSKILSATSAIEAETTNYYNFINSYLTDISAQNEGEVLTSP